MNNEQQELLDEAWFNFGDSHYGKLFVTKEDFIERIKDDPEFSQKWGLKIEERELSLEERMNLIKNSDDDKIIIAYCESPSDVWLGGQVDSILCKNNIPTKLITITYDNETIESYE
jgi:hypothetical protein